ncbi:MAG TPA: hypothetical protein VG603_04345 [Chitinophagales bacterium]|nr:hypothetical protein [Chitinophagales bacterium]
MKTLYTLIAAALLTTSATAKTYTVNSGKWTDATVWGNQYPGTTITANDVVIITGQVTMNTGIVVEGTLKVEKGAAMVGMKDLVISKNGKFENNGNTVMNRIINEGTINNNLIMEAMSDIENKGKIENNNNMVAGNNFDNYDGNATGTQGAYFINNTILTSPDAAFGKEVKVFYGNAIENSMNVPAQDEAMILTASLSDGLGVVLSVEGNTQNNVTAYNIEKSTDGQNFYVLQNVNANGKGLNYTDTDVKSALTYYRVTAVNSNGEQVVLPVAAVKAPTAMLTNNTNN